MDRGAWRAAVHGVAELDTTACTHTLNSKLSKQNPAHQSTSVPELLNIPLTHFATCVPTSSIDVFRAVAVLILSA